MKKLAIILVAALLVVACKNEQQATPEPITTTQEIPYTFPEAVSKVIEAHGGIDQWKKMNNLCFSLDKKDGEEVHTISLKNRMAKIETKDWTIGNDGKNTWLLQNKPDAYTGNAAFYHNLMFYFYAMPFVLADDGIVYTQLPQTELKGKLYNTVKIGYNDGVGYSPKDEYMLYSDPVSHKMTWLGYTVTGRSGEKSDQWSYIKYDQWHTINGLYLPKKLFWYTVENNIPTAQRNELVFNKVTITETLLENSVFTKPDSAMIVE